MIEISPFPGVPSSKTFRRFNVISVGMFVVKLPEGILFPIISRSSQLNITDGIREDNTTVASSAECDACTELLMSLFVLIACATTDNPNPLILIVFPFILIEFADDNKFESSVTS